MLGRVLINTRTRPSNVLILGRALGLDTFLLALLRVKINALYWPVNVKKNCVVRFIF